MNYVPLALVALWLTGGILVLVRNEAVYKYRMKLSEIAYQAGIRDIDAGRGPDSWRWYPALDAGPTYYEMVWKFWIPLRRFKFPEPLDAEIRREAA